MTARKLDASWKRPRERGKESQTDLEPGGALFLRRHRFSHRGCKSVSDASGDRPELAAAPEAGEAEPAVCTGPISAAMA